MTRKQHKMYSLTKLRKHLIDNWNEAEEWIPNPVSQRGVLCLYAYAMNSTGIGKKASVDPEVAMSIYVRGRLDLRRCVYGAARVWLSIIEGRIRRERGGRVMARIWVAVRSAKRLYARFVKLGEAGQPIPQKL